MLRPLLTAWRLLRTAPERCSFYADCEAVMMERRRCSECEVGKHLCPEHREAYEALLSEYDITTE